MLIGIFCINCNLCKDKNTTNTFNINLNQYLIANDVKSNATVNIPTCNDQKTACRVPVSVPLILYFSVTKI